MGSNSMFGWDDILGRIRKKPFRPFRIVASEGERLVSNRRMNSGRGLFILVLGRFLDLVEILVNENLFDVVHRHANDSPFFLLSLLRDGKELSGQERFAANRLHAGVL